MLEGRVAFYSFKYCHEISFSYDRLKETSVLLKETTHFRGIKQACVYLNGYTLPQGITICRPCDKCGGYYDFNYKIQRGD